MCFLNYDPAYLSNPLTQPSDTPRILPAAAQNKGSRPVNTGELGLHSSHSRAVRRRVEATIMASRR